MADHYWRQADPRPQVAVAPTPSPLKRPRPDYGGAPEMIGYYPRDEDNATHAVIRDGGSIYSHYDPYLQNGISPYASAAAVRPVNNRHRLDDPHLSVHGSMDGRAVRYGGAVEPPLPPDASNTLFVEGLPADCTCREVSHVFRPFVGFQEVRLVNKESKHAGGDPFVLCFVDFATAGHAAVALDALQGYIFDEHVREGPCLRLQFARFPGRRPSAGPHSRR